MRNAISPQDVIDFLKEMTSRETTDPVDTIDENVTFFELGFDSVNSLYLLKEIEDHFDIQLTPLDFWDYPTIRLLSEQIFSEFGNK